MFFLLKNVESSYQKIDLSDNRNKATYNPNLLSFDNANELEKPSNYNTLNESIFSSIVIKQIK